jgi:hypothetical protein
LLTAVVFNAIVLAVVMWGEVSAPLLGSWLMFTLVLTLGRYLLVRAYHRANPAPPEAGRWGRWFLLGTALSGLGWGAAGGLFFTEDSHIHRVYLAFLLAGMSAGSTSTLSVYPGAYRVFLLPALLPYTVQ